MIKCRLRAKSAHAQESCSPSNHQQQPCQICHAQLGKTLVYTKEVMGCTEWLQAPLPSLQGPWAPVIGMHRACQDPY